MSRLSLFEFEDFSWYPPALRDMETDLLQFWIGALGAYDAAIPLLARLLGPDESSITDLCSGGAGPWLRLKEKLEGKLGRELSVTLTDKFPNVPAFERARRLAGVEFVSESVDATDVPETLGGVRVLFSCFHHFPPPLARSILRNACERRKPIAIFEGTARRPLEMLGFLFIPPAVLASTPFVRPFRPSRFLFTYLLPIVPAVALWDGLASCMRTYSPDELRELTAGLGGDDYRWEAGRITRWLRPSVTYLLGYPV